MLSNLFPTPLPSVCTPSALRRESATEEMKFDSYVDAINWHG